MRLTLVFLFSLIPTPSYIISFQCQCPSHSIVVHHHAKHTTLLKFRWLKGARMFITLCFCHRLLNWMNEWMYTFRQTKSDYLRDANLYFPSFLCMHTALKLYNNNGSVEIQHLFEMWHNIWFRRQRMRETRKEPVCMGGWYSMRRNFDWLNQILTRSSLV